MGIFDKVKELFTEEYEETKPAPVKTEVMQVKIEAPVEDVNVDLDKTKEFIKPAPVLEQTPPPKPKPKMFFDDDDFKDLNKPIKTTPVKETTYGGKKNAVKTRFKPTPIISPIYGVLDKNYKKEDITHKRSGITTSYETNQLTLDQVRNKAFGNIDDELEAVVMKEHIFDNLDDTATIEITKSFKRVKLSDEDYERAGIINDLGDTKDITLEELDRIHQENEEKLEGSELFDLIDTMYERKDEEDEMYE